MQNRIRDVVRTTRPTALAVPMGFVLVSPGMLPEALAQAAAAQQDLYRLAYERALEAVESTRRVRRWKYRAAKVGAWN